MFMQPYRTTLFIIFHGIVKMSPEKAAELVDIDEFLEDMIGAISERLKKQEESIRKVQDDVRRLKLALNDISSEGGLRIDKSVLKLLRQ